MGVFIRQNDNRSQFQERLAADLRERAKQQASGAEPLDQSKRSNYIKNTEVTSGRAWLWFLVAGVLLTGFVIFVATR